MRYTIFAIATGEPKRIISCSEEQLSKNVRDGEVALVINIDDSGVLVSSSVDLIEKKRQAAELEASRLRERLTDLESRIIDSSRQAGHDKADQVAGQ